MAPNDAEIERTLALLLLERDCLRLTLANGGPRLSDVANAKLRAELEAEVDQARRRLPEVERQLAELNAASDAERAGSRQLVRV
jgi:hypothetical protein